MEQRNCKNCGSPLEHSYNHKCPYCGTLYDFNEPNYIEVKPEDLINVELKDISMGYLKNTLIFLFSGFKCEKPKIFEYNSNNGTYVSNTIKYINPPKCGFCMEIPIYEIERYATIDYIMNRLECLGVRPYELGKLKQDIQIKLFNYMGWYI